MRKLAGGYNTEECDQSKQKGIRKPYYDKLYLIHEVMVMRCMRCGNELQNTKCTGCGFDCSGGEYMTVFHLNGEEQKAIKGLIVNHEEILH